MKQRKRKNRREPKPTPVKIIGMVSPEFLQRMRDQRVRVIR
jgi:hypothetical protein